MNPEPTPSQTIGPFFHDALLGEDRSVLVPSDHPQAVRIEGTVYDGAGEPVPDAMVEIWQANAGGPLQRPHRRPGGPTARSRNLLGLRALGDRCRRHVLLRDRQARPCPRPDGSLQAPHVMVSVFARGLLRRLVTRIYFPDEEEANAADPVLSSIEDEQYPEDARGQHRGRRVALRHTPAGRGPDRLLRALGMDGEIFRPIFAPDEFREAVSGRAWLQAMLDAEAALASRRRGWA